MKINFVTDNDEMIGSIFVRVPANSVPAKSPGLNILTHPGDLIFTPSELANAMRRKEFFVETLLLVNDCIAHEL